MTDISALRTHFPFFQTSQCVYLDSGATSQKPQSVINRVNQFYQQQNANVHRGAHQLSLEATNAYESARTRVAEFLKVNTNEIVWTKGTTEAINIVAYGITHMINEGDVILISALEHHANIVPWQALCERTKATLKVIPIDDSGMINHQDANALIVKYKPKLVAISHASNVLGSINPIEPIIASAKQHGALTLIDGAQAVMHLRPNLKKLDCDFYAFSGHKMLSPTGVGVLYGRYDILNQLIPLQTGGEMISKVTFEQTTYRPAPAKFETGTPNISAVLGLEAAITYLSKIDAQQLREHEISLFSYLKQQLMTIDGIHFYGDLEHNIGTLSFNYRDEHCFDVSSLLDSFNIALRSGAHCAQPLMDELKIPGTVRVSLCFYNNQNDIDRFIDALRQSIEILSE